MYAARLRNGARNDYNVRCVQREIFWNAWWPAHNVFCTSGAAGDGRTTIHIYIYTNIFAHRFTICVGLASARPNKYLRAQVHHMCGARFGSPQSILW